MKSSYKKYSVQNNSTISEYVTEEKKFLKEEQTLIFENMEVINFHLSDLLRGKLGFSDIDKLNDCCSRILSKV